MDDHHNRKSEEKKKKEKRSRREMEGREQSSLPHALQFTALSPSADDAVALQTREEKTAKKLLRLHKQDGRTGEDPADRHISEKKKKRRTGLKLEEFQNHHLDDERLHNRNAIEHQEDRVMSEGELRRDIVNEEGKIKKKKKKKKREDMDVDVSLRRETHQEQEQQEEDQHTEEENLHAGNDTREKKKSKKKKEKKREEEQDRYTGEGNLLKENDQAENYQAEEKRSKKKKEKKREEEKEKVEAPSQKTPTDNHEQRKEKKARRLAKENWTGDEDVFEGVVHVNEKVAKKAKETQDVFRESERDFGTNSSVSEEESAPNKSSKHRKKSRNSVERGDYDPASNEDHGLLSNDIECSQGPLTDEFEHVTETSMPVDSRSKDKEKGKKKERKRKRVTFQDQINVADQQDVRDIPNAASENLMEITEEVWGVRFTAEEDKILKDAVLKYIKSKGWDEQEGLNKVFNSMKHKDARNCWADIKLSLPHRPRPAIRYRAHVLLEKGAHLGKWSEEEEQLLKRLQGEHGRKWKEISALTDRHRTSIKEKWRSLKRTTGKGRWTQGELQQLSDLVHKCLQAKALIPVEENKHDRHILRDDINWEKIADTIGTRNHGSCCGKWYYNLQSSLVTDGLWANEDDRLLLESLLESGACTEEEVEWDSLLNHRPGQVCLTRWKQMVKHLGENRTRQFLDKLDVLARRYAPELLEDSSIKENSSGSAHVGGS